jgi:hypothetical protein
MISLNKYNIKEGDVVKVDCDFANGGYKATVITIGKVFANIESEGNRWDIMIDRLTPLSEQPLNDADGKASEKAKELVEDKEYILCAAIYFNDSKEYPHQPVNIKTGFVVTGRRHHNCYATLSTIGHALGLDGIVKNKFERIDRDNQGFITNTDRYVNRKEAWKIACNSGQVKYGGVAS